jgi:hypothetical protein
VTAPPDREGDDERRGTDANTLRWRIGTVEKQIQELWDKKASVEAVLHVREDVKDVHEDVKNLRRVLLASALGWVGGAVALLLAVLQLTSH